MKFSLVHKRFYTASQFTLSIQFLLFIHFVVVGAAAVDHTIGEWNWVRVRLAQSEHNYRRYRVRLDYNEKNKMNRQKNCPIQSHRKLAKSDRKRITRTSKIDRWIETFSKWNLKRAHNLLNGTLTIYIQSILL